MSAQAPVSILVVDDNSAKRLALSAVLTPLGYLVVEADSGLAALRCIMAHDFAVILLDVCMPMMDGFETAALIRQRRQSEMTPIIFITAFGSDEIEHIDRYAEGAVDFIFAPVEPDVLRAKVSVFANLFIKARDLAARATDVQALFDQLQLLTDVAPIGIFRTDTDNRYVYTNPRWSEITGVAADDAAGQRWDTIMGVDQRAELLAEPAGTMSRQGEFSHRFEIPRLGSTPRTVLVTSVRIPDTEGRTAGWVGTAADVTAEVGAELAMSRARDAANAASQLKSDFLANMSHEIRTPMNGVIGMADLLLETNLDAHQRDYAETVRSSGEALLAIIDDILDFSKVEAGKLDIEDVDFDVRAVVEGVLDIVANRAQAKGLVLVAVVDDAVPGVVRGDPGRLRQVLTNLVGNAVKFTQAGEIVVRVTVAAPTPSSPADWDIVVRFEVSDSGDGIADAKLDMIFEPFVQADTSTSRRYGGTGLGLAISSQLVTLMGGASGVASKLGVGSTFWFTVCVHRAPGPGEAGPEHADGAPPGLTALVVDDNVTLRGILAGWLSDWGMEVATAGSDAGAKALQVAAAAGRPFAVALVDASTRGAEAPDELRSALAENCGLGTCLVLMTALGHDGDVDSGSIAGAGASLSKPVHKRALLAAVRKALSWEATSGAPVEPVGSAEQAGPESGLRPGRLLLAEDNLVNQKVAVAMLSGAGYEVDTVVNGRDAVEATAAETYAAVLMDCQMPVLNGYEATAAIRARDGDARRTPVIALTAGARAEDRARCMAEGMDGYLAKPLRKEALLSLVGQFVPRDPAVAGPSTLAPPAPPAPPSPAASARSGRPVLDSEILHGLERLGEAAGEDLVGQVAVLFLADAARYVAELHKGIRDGDTGEVARSAHTLSGASANVGATELARLCAVLADDRTDDLAVHAVLLEALEAELGAVRSALGSWGK